MKVKAALETGNRQHFEICTVELEEPRNNEVLVKIVACGICHTDAMMQSHGMLLGHEGCGIVVRTGAGVESVSQGDHVILSYTHCGHCRSCRDNRPFECDYIYDPFFLGYRLDGTSPVTYRGWTIPTLIRQGSFAEYAVVDETAVVKVSPDLNLCCLAPLGCGMMTGAGAVMNCLKAEPGRAIVISGLGGVGFGALAAAKMSECNPIIVIDRIRDRLELAADFGADYCIDSTSSLDLTDEILRCNNDEKVDYAFDSIGNFQLLNAIEQSLGYGAKACGVGGGRIDGFGWENVDEGHSIPQEMIPKMIEWYEKGDFPIDRLIKFYPFGEVNKAMEDMCSGRVIKPVLVM